VLKQPQRAFTTEFKVLVVQRIESGDRLSAVADEMGIRRKLLYEWRAAYRALGAAGLNRKRGPKRGVERFSVSPRGRASADAPPSSGVASPSARPRITVTRPLTPFWRRRSRLRLWAAFGRSEGSPEQRFGAPRETCRPERPSDQFRTPQGCKAGVVGLRLQQIGEARDPIENRAHAHEAVIPALQMRAGAGMRPVLRLGDQAGSDRIERDIAHRGDQMLLIQGNRAEAPLKQMTGLARPGVHEARIEPVRARQRQSEPSGVGGREDQMHVVGHQAIGPDLDAEFGAGRGEPIAIEGVVLVAEENALAAVASLRDMMRRAGKDDAGDARHACGDTGARAKCKDGRVTVIP